MRADIDRQKLRRILAQQESRFDIARAVFARYRECIDRSRRLHADALANSPLRTSHPTSTPAELVAVLQEGFAKTSAQAADLRQRSAPSRDAEAFARACEDALHDAEEAVAELHAAQRHFAEYESKLIEVNHHGELVNNLKTFAGI